MKLTDRSFLRPRSQPRGAVRYLVTAAFALGSMAGLGCDTEPEDGIEDRVGAADFDLEADGENTEAQMCLSLLPSDAPALQSAPAPQAMGFDFDTGNAAIEIVIPSVVPVIFQNVAPGDATIVLRFTTLLTNAWFDAIAPYHPTAVGVYSDLGRRPASEAATNANMNTALLYASYRVLNSLAPQNKAGWDAMMASVGLDPDDDHEGTNDAIGIGNAAGRALMDVRENDGFNQLGYEGGRQYNPIPYADYTGYQPVNTPYKLKNKRRWQPSLNSNRYGITRAQAYVTPQYALTLPYSYEDPTEWSAPPPLKTIGKGSDYKAQADEVLATSAALTDEQKMKAELFDDKIRSLGFSSVFASLSTGQSLMEWVHYDFTANLAAFDTGIIIWQEKTKYDAVRPFSAIEHIYGDGDVTAWGGPGMGTVNDLPASEWRPYLVTADHPEYPSGSASFCAAHAQASRLYFGSDDLNWTIPVPAGSSLVEPGVTPAADMNLHFSTWTEFAEDCGQSRHWGGVHFVDSIPAGADIGHEIGTRAYEFVQDHINGTVD